MHEVEGSSDCVSFGTLSRTALLFASLRLFGGTSSGQQFERNFHALDLLFE